MVVILKIGDVDVSDYAEQDNLSIRKSPVYSEGFTNVKGQTVHKCIGYRIDLSATFSNLPECVAKSIVNACNTDSLTVQYKDPLPAETVFERPVIDSTCEYEEAEDVQRWNISLSMTCSLKSSGL